MRWTDDELAEAVRRSDPASALDGGDQRGNSLERFLMLASAERTPEVPPSQPKAKRPRGMWLPALAPVAAIAILALVLVTIPGGTPRASAITSPRPLEFHAISETLPEVIAEAQAQLASAPGRVHPRRGVNSVGWFYNVDYSRDGEPTSVISPEVVELVWEADLSGYIRTVAGTPYWADGRSGTIPNGTRVPGELIWELRFAPGEFQADVVAMPELSAAGTAAMMRAYGMKDPANGFEVLSALDGLTSAWSLTNSQYADVLDMIQASDAKLLGSSTARDGQPVIGVSAPLPGGTASLHVLISSKTGKIVGAETISHKFDGTFAVDAIISYRMWETDPGAPERQ